MALFYSPNADSGSTFQVQLQSTDSGGGDNFLGWAYVATNNIMYMVVKPSYKPPLNVFGTTQLAFKETSTPGTITYQNQKYVIHDHHDFYQYAMDGLKAFGHDDPYSCMFQIDPKDWAGD